MGIREGFSEEVAEELSPEDEDSAGWKAGKVLQVVGTAGGNVGEKTALSRFGTELGTQVSGGGSSGRGTKDRSHRAEESQCYPEDTGEVAGEGVGPVWGLMLEKMSFSASQAGRRPPAFRSPGAQVRKQLSGPVWGRGRPSVSFLPWAGKPPCLSATLH